MHDTVNSGSETRLQIYHAGKVTVVGFGGQPVNSRINFSAYRGILTELVHRYDCRVLAFDLAGVNVAPSGMLGVLVPLRQLVDRIEIHNPTKLARETLAMIQKDSLFDICES